MTTEATAAPRDASDAGASRQPLAIVFLGYPAYTDAVAPRIHDRVMDDLAAAGIAPLDAGYVFRREQAPAAVQRIRQGGACGVIVVLLSWCSPAAAMALLTELPDLPILLYGVGARPNEEGVLEVYAAWAGAPALLRPMREAGLRFEYVFESPGEPTLAQEVAQFARRAAARADIRRSRVGTFGFADMQLLTTTLDPARLRLEVGPEVVAFDQLEMQRRAESLPPEGYQRYLDRLAALEYVPGQAPSPQAQERLARLTGAVAALAEQHRLDAFTIKCVEGLSCTMGLTPCMIGSLLGDELPYVCENDLPGVATHVMLRKLTGQTVTFLETYEVWKEARTVLLGACGFVPFSLVDGPLRARAFRLDMFEGVGCVSRLKTGRMTLARLIPERDGFAMHVVTGTAEPPPDWVEVGYRMPPHPSVAFRLDGPLEPFVEAIGAQHFSLVYGDHADALARLCRLMDIRVIRT